VTWEDPEEPEYLGPRWANGDSPEERESLQQIQHDFVRVAHVDHLGRPGYAAPASTFLIEKETKFVAWTQVSPSQIENYQKCNRLWFFKSIMRLPELQKGNQALGEGVHLILEVAEKVAKGQIPRQGYEYTYGDVAALDQEGWVKAEALAQLMVPMIPRSKPGRPLLREAKITLPTYENGPLMLGYMDLGVPPGIGWPELMIPDHAAIVVDYKTTSDFRYMKTPAELADSVQMMTYARWAIEDLPHALAGPFPEPGEDLRPISANEIYLTHLYARTKPPFTKNSIRHSVACVTPDQIEAKWQKTLDTVRQMDHDARASDAQDIAPTGVANDHCGAYGGCAYRDRCGLNAPNPIKNLFNIKPNVSSSPTESQDMSDTAGGGLLAKINAARAKAAGVAPPPAETPVVPTVASMLEHKHALAEPEKKPEVTPVAETPAPTAEPEKKSDAKGPVSALLAEIQQANGGDRPELGGLIALMYAKEQNLSFKPGSVLVGSGSLKSVTCKSMGELVALKAQKPASKPVQVPTGIVPADAPPREQSVITKPSDGVDPVKANDAATGEDSGEEDEEGDNSSEGKMPGDAVTSAQSASSAPTTPRKGRPTNAELAARKAAEAAVLEAEIERRVQERMTQAGLTKISEINPDIEALRASARSTQNVLEQTRAERDRAIQERDVLKDKINAVQRMEGGPSPVGMVLYVDCYPVKGKIDGTVDYLDWYAPIASGISEAMKIEDWRMIDYKSKGILAAAMRLVVGEGNIPGAMTISMQHPGADVAMEILSPLARVIVRRF
jgi:RecB family exonuclease